MNKSPGTGSSTDGSAGDGYRPAEQAAHYDAKQRRLYLGSDLKHAYLNRRELEVLRLILQGFKSGEIAHRLKLKQGTVYWYADRIKQKLRCSRRSLLRDAVIRHGLSTLLDEVVL